MSDAPRTQSEIREAIEHTLAHEWRPGEEKSRFVGALADEIMGWLASGPHNEPALRPLSERPFVGDVIAAHHNRVESGSARWFNMTWTERARFNDDDEGWVLLEAGDRRKIAEAARALLSRGDACRPNNAVYQAAVSDFIQKAARLGDGG